MRVSLLIIGIILLSSLISQVGAADDASSSCPIEETAPSITDYIKNIRKAVTNINTQLGSATPDTSKLNNTGNDISRIYNEMLVWDGYFTDYNYYLMFPMFNNIPSQIDRDFQLLENETEGLKKYLKSTVKRGYSNISLSKDLVCSDVTNCELEGNAIDVLGDIIQNHIEIVTLYKQIVIEPNDDTHSSELILTIQDSSTFIDDLEAKYGSTTIETCGNEADSFGGKIDASIDVITTNFTAGNDGLQKWRDAWALLVGAVNGETDQDLEIELLTKELARQGVPSNMSDTLVQNLKDFNDPSISNIDNNFVTHSFKQIYESGIKIKDAYNEVTSNLFPEDTTVAQNAEAVVGIETLRTEKEKQDITNNIQERLGVLYNKENSFAAIDSYESSKVILNIIKMHSNIAQSSEIMKEAAAVSVKVCDSQGKGQGNCTN